MKMNRFQGNLDHNHGTSDQTLKKTDGRLKSWRKGLSANPLKENYDPRLIKQARSLKITMNLPLMKAKISKKSKGRYFSAEARQKMSKAHKGKKVWNIGLTQEIDERIKKSSQKIKAKHSTKEAREANSKRMRLIHANPNSVYNSLEYRKKKSIIMKRQWKNLEFIKKWIQGQANGQHISPNKLEEYYNKITPKCVKFIGNKKDLIIMIQNKIHYPDFQIIKTNKIIELFGDYWHKGENPDVLINEYKKVGWDCIIFWEREIYNETKRILKETLEFINK